MGIWHGVCSRCPDVEFYDAEHHEMKKQRRAWIERESANPAMSLKLHIDDEAYMNSMKRINIETSLSTSDVIKEEEEDEENGTLSQYKRDRILLNRSFLRSRSNEFCRNECVSTPMLNLDAKSYRTTEAA